MTSTHAARLHEALPAPACDIAGACSALYDLGALVVVHGPASCLDAYAACDEPRLGSPDHPARIFASGLGEGPAVGGAPSAPLADDAAGDAALAERICALWERFGGPLVALVGTPCSVRVGTGYAAVVHTIEERCEVPVVVVPTRGFAPYGAGVSLALTGLARTLARRGGVQASRRSSHTVNLLGATPLDLARDEDVEGVRDALAASGWRVVSSWARGSSVDELTAGMASAQVNVVLTGSGLPLARWMRDELGIPYVWGTLSGERGTLGLVGYLGRVVAGEADAACPPWGRTGAEGPGDARGLGGRALVVADRVLAESLRRALADELGFSQVDVACAVPAPPDVAALLAEDAGAAGGAGSGLLADGGRGAGVAAGSGDAGDGLGVDHGCVDEEELARLCAASDLDLVVGDPCLRALMPEGAGGSDGPRFLAIPQVGLGGRLTDPDAARSYGPLFTAAALRALGR